MNFSVLDFFKFASRMPQIAQILVLTFKIWGGEGGGPQTPLEVSSFFFMSNSRLWVSRLLSTATGSIIAETKACKLVLI